MKKDICLRIVITNIVLLLGLFFPCFSKAALKGDVASSWDFWYLYPFEKKYNKPFFFSGSSTLALYPAADYNEAILYFGINSSRDGNFNIVRKNELLFYGNLYLDINLKRNDKLSLGFRQGDLTKAAIFNQRNYRLGVPLLPLYYNYNNNLQNRVVFDGSYIQYNNAFAINYSKKIFLGNTNFSVNYIPNLDFNLSNNASFYKKLQKNLGAVDIALNYYNEYKDIGYGIIGATRIYAKDGVNPKGVDFYVTPNVDYLGFGVSASFLGGAIKGSQNSFNYKLTEASIYYSILKFNIMAIYGYNAIEGSSNYGNYYYSNASLSFGYLVNSHFALKAAVFSNKTKDYNANQGIALGFNVNI